MHVLAQQFIYFYFISFYFLYFLYRGVLTIGPYTSCAPFPLWIKIVQFNRGAWIIFRAELVWFTRVGPLQWSGCGRRGCGETVHCQSLLPQSECKEHRDPFSFESAAVTIGTLPRCWTLPPMTEFLELRACLVRIKGRHALKWGTCSFSNTEQQCKDREQAQALVSS